MKILRTLFDLAVVSLATARARLDAEETRLADKARAVLEPDELSDEAWLRAPLTKKEQQTVDAAVDDAGRAVPWALAFAEKLADKLEEAAGAAPATGDDMVARVAAALPERILSAETPTAPGGAVPWHERWVDQPRRPASPRAEFPCRDCHQPLSDHRLSGAGDVLCPRDGEVRPAPSNISPRLTEDDVCRLNEETAKRAGISDATPVVNRRGDRLGSVVAPSTLGMVRQASVLLERHLDVLRDAAYVGFDPVPDEVQKAAQALAHIAASIGEEALVVDGTVSLVLSAAPTVLLPSVDRIHTGGSVRSFLPAPRPLPMASTREVRGFLVWGISVPDDYRGHVELAVAASAGTRCAILHQQKDGDPLFRFLPTALLTTNETVVQLTPPNARLFGSFVGPEEEP